MTKDQAPDTTAALLPCPFCGGSDLRVAYLRATADCRFWRVECANEACDASTLGPSHLEERQAIAAWNTRATPRTDTTAALVEAVSHLRDRAKGFRKAALEQGERVGPLAAGFEDAAIELENRFLAAHRATPQPSADVAGQVAPSPAEIAERVSGETVERVTKAIYDVIAGLFRRRYIEDPWTMQDCEPLAEAAIRALDLTDIGAPGVDRGEGI